MSIITTNSSVVSILKAQSPVPKTSPNRVRFQFPTNIKNIFENYKSDSNSQEYQALVCTIRDTEIDDSDLLSLLAEAKDCIPILNHDLRLFVQAVNIIKWTHRSDEVVMNFQEFIYDLVSAHSQHTKIVIDQLVKLFVNIGDTEWVDCEPVEIKIREFDNIHTTLKSIMAKVPLSENLILESLSHNFPHFLQNVTMTQQLSYLYNTLQVITYQPHLRVNILQTVLDQLLARDVYSPKEDILKAEQQQNDGMFDMDLEDDLLREQLKHPVADCLDGMMEILLKFIRSECYEEGKLMEDRCQKLFEELLNLFERIILPTHSHHIQFTMFYMCSLENTLPQQFLKYLWSKAISSSLAPIIRQSCIYYIAGFLARADYVLPGYMRNYLSKMSEWINNYISNCGQPSGSRRRDHSVFYYMCQSLFYLVAIRHEDIADSRSTLSFLQSLNLSKMVTCKLNPLQKCPLDLVDRFADVACDYQLAYCYTIMENNARNTLMIVDKDGKMKKCPDEEIYYPFDPLILPRTNALILPQYKQYRGMGKNKIINEVRQFPRPNHNSAFRGRFPPAGPLNMAFDM